MIFIIITIATVLRDYVKTNQAKQMRIVKIAHGKPFIKIITVGNGKVNIRTKKR